MNKIKKNEEISVTNGSVEIGRSKKGIQGPNEVLPNGIFCQEVMLPNEVLPKGVLPKGVFYQEG